MPTLMYGFTTCSLCDKLLQPGEKTIGVSPCIPMETYRCASLLVPQDYLDSFDLEAWRIKMRRIFNACDESLAYYNSLDESHEWRAEGLKDVERHRKWIDNMPLPIATINGLGDSLMHYSCYENHPLRQAIDFLRGEDRVWVVNPDGSVDDDEGTSVISKERVAEIVDSSYVRDEETD